MGKQKKLKFESKMERAIPVSLPVSGPVMLLFPSLSLSLCLGYSGPDYALIGLLGPCKGLNRKKLIKIRILAICGGQIGRKIDGQLSEKQIKTAKTHP